MSGINKSFIIYSLQHIHAFYMYAYITHFNQMNTLLWPHHSERTERREERKILTWRYRADLNQKYHTKRGKNSWLKPTDRKDSDRWRQAIYEAASNLRHPRRLTLIRR